MSKKKVSKKTLLAKKKSVSKSKVQSKKVVKKKGKSWKQGDLELPGTDGAVDRVVDGRLNGRFHDTELAQEMGRTGGAVGGSARVKTTSDLFRTLNSKKAACYRWNPWNPTGWTEADEKALDEARTKLQREKRSEGI